MSWHGIPWPVRFRQTTLVFGLSFAFLLGVAAARSGMLIDWLWPLLAGGLALFAWRRHSWWTFLWVVLFGLSLGWWRGSVYMQHLASFQQYFGRKITIVAIASDDATYDSRHQLSFTAHNPVVAETGQQLRGKVSLKGFGAPAVFAGDQVKVTGKLRPGYGADQAELGFGSIRLVEPSHSLVASLRRQFRAGLQTALPEPLASFGMGLLIGQKADLPDQVYQSLLMVGLVHIIAVSGYNLTIILRASDRLLKRRSKRLALLLSFGLIGIFLLFAGASASIVRAAIISVLGIAAAYYGRTVKPLVLLMLAAAITGWLNPYYIWTDVSWYLSFSAFFGVLVVAPRILLRLPERWRQSLPLTIAVESLAAEIMTMPYVLYIFGQLSFIGIVANVLVATVVPLAMLLCLVAGLAGMLLPLLAGWFAWPARLLLNYMLDGANLLSRIPHIFAQHIVFSLTQLVVLYAALSFAVLVLWHRTKRLEAATITDEEAAPEP